MTEAVRKTVLVDGLATGYLEAGQGDPVVLLHGGEFGVSADLGWERNIAALAAHYRVLALDMLGFGQSAKVIDFNDGRGMRIRHIARFCDAVGVQSAHFVGNSMGAVNMFVDATSESPVLPARSLVMICGGGEIQRNEHSAALYDYDATLPGMRRIVEALFHDRAFLDDDAYVAASLRVEHRARRVGGVGRRTVPQARARAAATAVEPARLRAHRRPHSGGRGGVRQTAARWLGRRDRQTDPAGSVSGDRAGRSLPADRTARCRQPVACGFPQRRDGRKDGSPVSNELEGKVAIVTGGASGLGEGLARRFAAEGAKVLIGDVDSDAGVALAADIGADAHFVEADVSDTAQVSGLVSTAVERFGGLHVMVNNAGVSGTMHRRLFDDDLADFEKIMAVNLRAVMAGTRDAARHMSEHGGGSIINVTSIGGILAGGGVMTYRASKAAVIQFTKSAAIELAHYEIRVNAIAPGNIRTAIVRKSAAGEDLEKLEQFEEKIREQMRNDRPLKREGTVDDVAEAALYFATDRSRYVTGTVLPVDGGTVAGKVIVRKPKP